MSQNRHDRITINKVDQRLPFEQWKPLVADIGRRRHLSYSFDFDTRALLFEMNIGEQWDEQSNQLHLENRERVKRGLAVEFGTDQIETKVENFIAIGPKPFSVLAHHNLFFDQVRKSFVVGNYYPALVGACALGEQVLNHLILDLRSYYSHTTEFKKVHRKTSFNDWRVPIDALDTWGVLLPKAVMEFRALMALRNHSIHFNVSTYQTLKEDALAAIIHIREIIDQQFSAFADRPWFIKGTRGIIFLKREWEKDPFIRTYFLPRCPLVGPYFAISFASGSPLFHDYPDYGDGVWTDEEFAATYEARTPEQIRKTE